MSEFKFSFNNTNMVIGGDFIDDPWVQKHVDLHYTRALGNKQIVVYDLVDTGYLPNDNFDYEILIDGYMWTVNANGQIVGLWLYSVGRDYNVPSWTTVESISPYMFRTRFIRARSRANNHHAISSNNCIFPIINGGKKLVFWNTDTNNSHTDWAIRLKGYRRLGTNA